MKNLINIVGCGWLGKALGKYLNAKGYDVIGSTTSEANIPALRELGIQPYIWQLGNPGKSQPFEMPAAKSAVILLSPKVIVPNWVELTQTLTSCGTKHLILASSSGVYPNTNDWVMEEEAIHRISPHSQIDVLEMENRFLEDARFNTTVLRFAGLYGPGREPGNFLQSANPYSGGSNPVNLVHQQDCLRALFIALIDEPDGQCYNICADAHPGRAEFYTQAAKALGNTPPVFTDPHTTPHKCVSNQRFKEKFGFTYLHQDPTDDIRGENVRRK